MSEASVPPCDRHVPLNLHGRVWPLMLIAMLFAVAGISLPIFNARVVGAIERTSRYEPTLTMINIRALLARLEAAAAVYELDGSPAHASELRLSLALVKSRLTELRVGQLGQFVAGKRERLASAEKIDARMAELDSIVWTASREGIARAVRSAIQMAEPPLAVLTRDVVSESSRLTAADQDEMRFSQRAQMAMLIGVVASGFALIFVISRQNAGLQRAHLEERRAAETFARIAMRDALTGLYNRNGFAPAVEAACARAHERGDQIALLTLDLDKFKVINDVFSHATGDAMLKSVAGRIEALTASEPRHALARLGGDEFAVLIEGGDAAARAEALAREIVKSVREPHEIGRVMLSTDTSIGIAHAPAHGREASDLMLASDIALYRAKAAGRGVACVFQQSESNQGLGRATLEARLLNAIAAREFLPYYQPQIDLRTGRIVAIEALIRWRHNDVIVPPSDFLPFAEATGLIVNIDRALLTAVCDDLPRLPADIKVSVNLSAAQMFCLDVVEGILTPIANAGVDPGRLEVEITETMLLANVQRVSEVMTTLQQAGLSIALDDFGSGYSSLGYLRRFPFDKLKIDKMFVEDLSERSQAFSIIKTIVALGRALNQTVVAEGIETLEQARIIQLAGCHLGQGFFMARPVGLGELLRLVADRNSVAPSALSA